MALPNHCVVLPPCRSWTAWRNAIASQATLKGWRLSDALKADSIEDRHDSVLSICTSVEAALDRGADVSEIVILLGLPDLDDEDHGFYNIESISRCLWDAGRLDEVRRLVLPTEEGRLIEIAPGLEVACPDQPKSVSARSKAAAEALGLLMGEASATWSPELFNYDVRSVDLAMSGLPFDITGKPRFLISGPYIVMRPATWQAKIKFGFDEGASRSRFRVDWGGVEVYEAQEFSPSRPGYFEIIMEHRWTEAAPSEVRLVQLEGVFDGDVSFGGGEITEISNPA